MRFLVDAQLPPALARWLTDAGHEAVHVEDLGLRNASDREIWRRALQDGAAIITKDEDFALRCATATNAPTIVWLRVGNATNPVLKGWMDERLAQTLELLGSGCRLIEVR